MAKIEAEQEFEKLKNETPPDLLPPLSDFEKDAMRYRHLRNKDVDTFKKGKSHGARGLFVGQITENKDFVLSEQELDDAIDNEMKLMECKK